MRIFGLEITRPKQDKDIGGLSAVPYSNPYSFFGPVREAFSGAWQKNAYPESPKNMFAFSAVYASVGLIAGDIAKLKLLLTQDSGKGYWTEVQGNTSHINVLAKPNRYQTRMQFIMQWVTSKLIYGNAYLLKERDARGIVTDLYVLDPRLVVPMVATDGSVFYQVNRDYLSGMQEPFTFPASEIIHDRMLTLWHPLVGVSPIFACGAAATQGIRIQENSAAFFGNQSRPSVTVVYPTNIPDEQAKRVKEQFESLVSGHNLGRAIVMGNDAKVTPMTMPATDSQLVAQLGWTIEDVARCFQIPLHKISQVAQRSVNYASIGALNQDYYTSTLQFHIESMEALLDEGLNLPATYHATFDLSGLLRLDPASRIETAAKGVTAGIIAPNEARLGENLPGVIGGESPMIQQQNFSLAALAKRDAKADPFAPAGTPDSSGSSSAATSIDTVDAQAAGEAQALAMTHALIEKIMKTTLHA